MATVDRRRKAAPRPKRRGGEKKSLNLSLCVEHHTRFLALGLLLGRAPSELLMDWVDEKSAGMRFSIPGFRPLEGPGVRDDGESAPVEPLPEAQTLTAHAPETEGPSPGAGEGSWHPAGHPALVRARRRGA